MKIPPMITPLEEGLRHLLFEAKENGMTIGEILKTLGEKGQAILVVLLTLPFCQPIQIPGFSTPFGIILGFIGFRIAFGQNVWLPKVILNRHVSYDILKKITLFAIKISNKLSFLFKPRLTWLVQRPNLHILHGLTISLLAFFLALPLPIPFTNLLSAYPLLLFGLGILEEDGVMIIIAYILSFICFAFFFALAWFGKASLSFLF